MNFKLILKTLFIVALLSLLVYMGMYNPQTVGLRMPQFFIQEQKLPAALMYYAFFAVGFLAGTILMVGGKGGGGKGGGKGK